MEKLTAIYNGAFLKNEFRIETLLPEIKSWIKYSSFSKLNINYYLYLLTKPNSTT